MTVPAVAAVTAVRYVQPLREGGSLPAVVEAEDGGLWVAKFRGAGQGARVLIAELVVGLLAQTLGLPVPALATVDLPAEFGRIERDPEIQELLRRSEGVNVGLRYLDGAFNFDPLAAGDLIDAEFAARVVWLDAYTMNPDRSARNPNLMIWERRPWLIDHGAALYVQHDWRGVDAARALAPFPLVRQHVLLAASADLRAADAALAPLVTDDALGEVLAQVPDALFDDP
ncbi:MAG TPA: HipA family kinase, partial [Gemmatirosa sp.]